MRIRKKYIQYIYLSTLLTIPIILLILLADPESVILSSPIKITFLHIFILVFFLCIASFFTFLFKKVRRGILVSCFLTGIVILKLLDLDRIQYVLMLFLIITGTELYFRMKKNGQP
ncbi:MAG: hypothetical protein KA477_00205 [Candidatus Levybacteria bacterium]|nr:hypothetical protein [Candidatus Levybacteria bacterium]